MPDPSRLSGPDKPASSPWPRPIFLTLFAMVTAGGWIGSDVRGRIIDYSMRMQPPERSLGGSDEWAEQQQQPEPVPVGYAPYPSAGSQPWGGYVERVSRDPAGYLEEYDDPYAPVTWEEPSYAPEVEEDQEIAAEELPLPVDEPEPASEPADTAA